MTPDSGTSRPSPPARLVERLAPESLAFSALRARTAAILGARAPEIAARWAEQARIVALRELPDVADPAPAEGAALVESLAEALASDGTTSDALVARGFTYGSDAFAGGGSLPHALKALDLLTAMALYAVETHMGDEEGATAADGVRLSRRLQQAASFLSLAATKGYTLAMSEAMRERFRHLRHDLRNPLGTIKSVLAMMDDETIPADTRTHPRFRTMAKRNARSLGELIADRLNDAAALAPALVQQRASLRTIACSVRRDLRAAAESRGVEVALGPGRARVMVDAVALELLLHELLLAALREAVPGDVLRVEFGEVRGDRASVTLSGTSAGRPVTDADTLARLAELAASMRGRLEAGDRALSLVVPVERVDVAVWTDGTPTPAPAAGPADVAPVSGGREAAHDLRGAREREHGQPRSL